MSVRLPQSLADDVIREADRMGLTISDYMVVVAAKAHGHEIPEYVQRKLRAAEGQSQLPLGACPTLDTRNPPAGGKPKWGVSQGLAERRPDLGEVCRQYY